MKYRTLGKLALAGLTFALMAWSSPLRAQSTESTPPPAATSTTPAAVAPTAPAPAAPAAATPLPKLEERVASLEAYIGNSDPSAPYASYKDKDGNLPKDFKGPALNLPGPGHNGWMMTCAALVLFMTLPGLALFYGGLVRHKNVLSVVAQCFGIAGLVTILWVICGYSFVFADGEHAGPVIGDFFKYKFLEGVDSTPNTHYSPWVSHNVFAMYQLMFAIITPALIVGAIAERMKFSAIMLFVTVWMFVVYFPLAHMIWGSTGYMNGVGNPAAGIKAIDFAGGTVVHMSSGWSALVLCIILGKRQGFGKTIMAPHSMVLCAVGTGMLWVGWYGFNAGSAVAADVISANAFTTTTVATATACFVWALLEHVLRGKPSILGFCSGAVAGLVVITPACGFVTVKGALIIGVLAAIIPFFFCTYVKKWFGYDDALDTFGVHAVGGTIGALLTGILANPTVNANLAFDPAMGNAASKNGLAKIIENNALWLEQLKAMGLTILMAVVATVVIAYVIKLVIGLRPTPEVESTGLDLSEHGEAGYEM